MNILPHMALAALALALPLGTLAAQAPAKPAPAKPAPGPTSGNAAAGARQYLQCRACHTATAGGVHTVGPNLWGIMGAKAGAKPGFAYSPAMKSAAFAWSPEAMDAFLAKPNARVPGNKMAFAGMANPVARRDLVAYLATLRGK